MRFPDQHLSADEIELLAGEGDFSDEMRSGLSEAREHVGVCEECRQAVSVYRDTGSTMEILRNPGGVPKQVDCPPLDVWLQVAGGLLTPAENNKYLDHAAQCDYCGAVLKEIYKDFHESTTQDEWIELNHLDHTVKMPAEVMEPLATQRPAYRDFSWYSAIAAAIILIATGVFFFQHFKKSDEDKTRLLLAQAYREKRTIELRIPGADYAVPKVERGIEPSHFQRPQALLDSESIIGQQLANNPNDARWLRLKGEAEILDGDYRAAIETLEDAKAKQDNDQTLVDLATAYFEYAEANPDNRETAYGTAIDLLSAVLRKVPDNHIAVFNRAIIYSKIQHYDQAAIDWHHYLIIDPNSNWAKEARRRLEEVDRIRDRRTSYSDDSLLNFASIAALASLKQVNAWNTVDSRIEEYSDLATRVWLPKAFPFSNMCRRSQKNAEQIRILRALDVIATILEKRHDDRWLREMLQSSPPSSFCLGIHELQKSIEAISRGDSVEGESESQKAVISFVRAGSLAGRLRAQFEQLYALQRSQDGKGCVTLAKQLTPVISYTHFSWLKAQLLMEEASCLGQLNNFRISEPYADSALKITRKYGFHDLELRALAIAADIELSTGNLDKAWMHDREGLKEFWNGMYSPVRGYSFYDNIEYVAEEYHLWHFATAAGVEAISFIETTPNSNGKALAHYRLATDYLIAGEDMFATEEFSKANSILSFLPQTAITKIYILYGHIFLSALQPKISRTATEIELLKNLQPALRNLSNYIIALDFYRTLASLYLRQEKYAEAEQAAVEAVTVAEEGLHTISRMEARVAWINENSDLYRLYVRSYIEHRGDARGSLQLWEWYRAAPLRRYGRSDSSKILRIKDGSSKVWINKNEHLWSKHTYIAYFQLDDGLFVWIVNGQKIDLQWIPISATLLQQHVELFLTLCSNPQSDIGILRKEGALLYSIIFSPIENKVARDASLVIEPDGVVNRIPLQALVDSYGFYLGERHSVIVAAGMAFFKNELRISSTDSALIVKAASMVSDMRDLPALPGAEEEAKQISAFFIHSRSLINSQATAKSVSQALVRVKIFHFIGHALVAGHESGLLLSSDPHSRGDGHLLSIDSIWRMNLSNLKLVVLSSCTTDRNMAGPRKDSADLIQALLESGTPHVLASKWNVDSVLTGSLISEFYRNVLDGNSIGGSLQSASASLRKNELGSHPYYWAAFTAFGQP